MSNALNFKDMMRVDELLQQNRRKKRAVRHGRAVRLREDLARANDQLRETTVSLEQTRESPRVTAGM